MSSIESIEKDIIPVKRKVNFEIGDTIKVHYRIVEGERERIQLYEGIVIAIDNKGISKTFTVRRISYDVGVERVFPVFSTRIAKIEVVRKGKKRRAKLYFLRERTGKSAKLKERRMKAKGPGLVEDEPDEPVAESTETAEPAAESTEIAKPTAESTEAVEKPDVDETPDEQASEEKTSEEKTKS